MEADISTLRKTGHFYFALTSRDPLHQEHCAGIRLAEEPAIRERITAILSGR